jgi:hypothetical protein
LKKISSVDFIENILSADFIANNLKNISIAELIAKKIGKISVLISLKNIFVVDLQCLQQQQSKGTIGACKLQTLHGRFSEGSWVLIYPKILMTKFLIIFAKTFNLVALQYVKYYRIRERMDGPTYHFSI